VAISSRALVQPRLQPAARGLGSRELGLRDLQAGAQLRLHAIFPSFEVIIVC